MKRKVETRRTGEKSRKCITSTLQELSLRKALFSDKKQASQQGKEPSLFRACAVFLAKKVFPACYFALHDSLRDTRPFTFVDGLDQVPLRCPLICRSLQYFPARAVSLAPEVEGERARTDTQVLQLEVR